MPEPANDFSLVLLCVESNVQEVVKNLGVYRAFLSPKNIVVVGAKSLESFVPADARTEFLDEDTILDGLTLGAVREEIRALDENAVHRSGWYFQQFLKLSYAFASTDARYLVWDADTVPLHQTRMRTEGKNVFDVKGEYNKAYFDTLGKIMPGLKKEHGFSFISEHMLFECAIVRELVEKIESAGGKPFWRTVLRNIDRRNLPGSGFSEFETYGTYAMKFHPGSYTIRPWKSFREEAVFFPRGISAADFNKLGLGYDAKSFESHESHKKLSRIFGHKPFQNRWCISLFVLGKGFAKKIRGQLRAKKERDE